MDMRKRQLLISKALALLSKSVLPAVPMDEFFDGNTDDRSMGRGMGSRDIPITEYREVFRSIRDRYDVQEIFVEFNELWGDEFPESWPQAHIVFIVTSARMSDVEAWVEQLDARYVDEGWCVRPGTGHLYRMRSYCLECAPFGSIFVNNAPPSAG